MKRLTVLGLILIINGFSIAEYAAIEIIDELPKGNQVMLSKYTKRFVPNLSISWKYIYQNEILSENSPGQIFKAEQDFAMNGLCLRLTCDNAEVKQNTINFKLTISKYTAADDLKSETVLNTYYCSLPWHITNAANIYKWIQINLPVEIDLHANNFYGFLIEFIEPTSDCCRLATLTVDANSHQQGWLIKKEGGGLFPDKSSCLHFIILGDKDLHTLGCMSESTVNHELQKAYDTLFHYGNWTEREVFSESQADDIANSLLLIAKVMEIRGSGNEDVLNCYYKICKEFSQSPYAIKALSRIVVLDERDGLAYAKSFFEKNPKNNEIVELYGNIIRNYLKRSDYRGAEEYIRLFVDDNIHGPADVSLIEQLLIRISGISCTSDLYKIIIKNIIHRDVDSYISGMILRRGVLELLAMEKSEQAWNFAQWAADKYAGTKLADYANAVLADRAYEMGDYICIPRLFVPDIFTRNNNDKDIIEDIDYALTAYKINTLSKERLDFDKIYQALARKLQQSGFNTIAIHCYKKAACSKNFFDIWLFEDAALKGIRLCNCTPEKEVWFWKGLFAAQQGNMVSALAAYRNFLDADDSSVYAAKAYYDIARTKLALGQDAKEAIDKAKAISPCEPVLKLEEEINISDMP